MPKTNYRTFSRFIRINFYTSSSDKLLQARLSFSERGYQLGYYRGRQEPYDEDYSSTTTNLLERGIKTVTQEFGLRSPFFIEDTSIRIDALSSQDQDFPGLRAKEWFAQTTFHQLDQQLKANGNNRTAWVKSDIALHLPNYDRPIFFHGETKGVVAPTPPDFDENPLYPWLTPRTFNGWFIPDGHELRLGEMEYERSLDFDFRVRSLRKLLDYYDQINAALNIPVNFVEARTVEFQQTPQLSFSFQPNMPVVCVIGDKCAGKTTLANFLLKEHDAIHLEASSLFGEICQLAGFSPKGDEEVLRFLEIKGFDIVARRVLDRMLEIPNKFVVVTGLRTPEELALLLGSIDNLVVVHISADQRLRYERHVKRQRDPGVSDFKSFKSRDALQKEYGLLQFAAEIADIVVTNNGSMAEFLEKVDALASQVLQGGIQRAADSAPSEGYRSLKALVSLARTATCEEISAQTAADGDLVRVYNTNRALKEMPQFAERVENNNALLSYRPTLRAPAMIEVLDNSGARRPFRSLRLNVS